MQDKYYLNDILEMEKNMTVNMAIALNEASHEKLYNEFFKIFEAISEETKELFKIAYNKNWYQLENAKENKINTQIKKMCSEIDCGENEEE